MKGTRRTEGVEGAEVVGEAPTILGREGIIADLVVGEAVHDGRDGVPEMGSNLVDGEQCSGKKLRQRKKVVLYHCFVDRYNTHVVRKSIEPVVQGYLDRWACDDCEVEVPRRSADRLIG